MRKGTYKKYKPAPLRGIKKIAENLSKTRQTMQEVREELYTMAEKAISEKLKTHTDTFDAMLAEHRAIKLLLAEIYGITQGNINTKVREANEVKSKK